MASLMPTPRSSSDGAFHAPHDFIRDTLNHVAQVRGHDIVSVRPAKTFAHLRAALRVANSDLDGDCLPFLAALLRRPAILPRA